MEWQWVIQLLEQLGLTHLLGNLGYEDIIKEIEQARSGVCANR